MEAKDRSALVLFSGGQDSTACLAWALTTYLRVETVGFDYGQRHHVELKARQDVITRLRDEFPNWGARLGADHVIDLTALGQISDTALTSEAEITVLANGLPSTFVPGRNLAFLTLAAALAYRRGIAILVGGMCETDFSGYPDCRDETLKAMEQTLKLGMDFDVSIQTPLMRIDKAGTWDMIERLGGTPLINIVVDATHTCYRGERGKFHLWGYGCGACPACDLRAGGFVRWKARKEKVT